MPPTTSNCDVELTLYDGTVLGLMFARDRDPRTGEVVDGKPVTLDEALAAAASDSPLSEWLEAVVQEDWSGGFGVDYNAAYALDTWSTPGYVLPAGVATEVTLPAGGNSASPIVAICEFGGDLWVAQQGTAAVPGRVLRSVGGSGAFSATTFAVPLVAGEYIRDLLVADDGTSPGVSGRVLFASSSSVTGASGRMHKWNPAGPSWTSTAAGTFGTAGRNEMVGVSWTDNDGVSAPRIITSSSNQGHYSYTRPGGDPMTALGWVEMIDTPATERLTMTAARRHAWFRDSVSVYDVNELGELLSLLSESTRFFGTAPPVAYLDGYVYYSHAVGLGRVRVDQGPIVQEVPGTCSPGYLTRTESPAATGYCTALLPYQGGIFAAMYPTGMGVPVIFWGRDREYSPDVKTANPLVWHGPVVLGTEHAVVTKMYVHTLLAAPSQSRLFVASWNTDQVSNPRLAYVSLPAAGGAMAGLGAQTAHRFATGAAGPLYNAACSLERLPATAGDKGATKHAYTHTYGTRGLGDPAGTKLTVYQRFDAAPGSAVWGTGHDILAGPTEDFVSPPTFSGHKFEDRIDFFSPGGTASPPKPAILDSIRLTFFRTAVDVDVWTLAVEYGPGVVDLQNTPWEAQGRSVDDTTAALLSLCRGNRTTLRARDDRQYSVKVKQVLQRQSTHHDGLYGKTTTALVVLGLLGDA